MERALFFFAAALLAVAVYANGPASVAELSDTSGARAEALTVTIPVGSHVAVAVTNTDAVTPNPPAGIAATVRVMWLEQRRVFVGKAEERDAAIPYYLPLPKDCTPTGSWVVELAPQAAGTYVVPLVCNSNTVTVTVRCVEITRSGIGYGFYTDPVRMADPDKEGVYYADMAAHGMNTFTPYAREVGPRPWDYAQCLASHIDTAIAAGLVDNRFPLLCLSTGYADLARAQGFAKTPWPELWGYGNDEPAITAGAAVAETSAAWHAVGAKTATAIDGATALAIGAPLDGWIIHMDSMSVGVVSAAKAAGKRRWLYNCALRGSNAALHRYMTGVYTWATAPEVCLIWTYMHSATSRITPAGAWAMERVYDTASADREGNPIPTVALEGLQEGIIDSRLLQELERRDTRQGRIYLGELRRQVPLTFWPDGRNRDYSSYVWDVPDLAVPPVDMVKMRRDVLRLLGM